jgi:PIN domain nuclease of toxin-antitoxin system
VSAERAGVLLDTNAMIWLLAGDERMSQRGRAMVADERRRLVVSAVSLWEAVIRRSLGKLKAPPDLSRRLAALRQVELLPISPLHAEAVGDLPWHHRDPFDRMLVAQALAEKLAIVSSDPALAQYGVEVVW